MSDFLIHLPTGRLVQVEGTLEDDGRTVYWDGAAYQVCSYEDLWAFGAAFVDVVEAALAKLESPLASFLLPGLMYVNFGPVQHYDLFPIYGHLPPPNDALSKARHTLEQAMAEATERLVLGDAAPAFRYEPITPIVVHQRKAAMALNWPTGYLVYQGQLTPAETEAALEQHRLLALSFPEDWPDRFCAANPRWSYEPSVLSAI